MVKIFFLADDFRFTQDAGLNHLLDESHGYRLDESWVYGVCTPRAGIDPLQVAEKLEEMGAEVLSDSDAQVSAKVSEKLAKHVSPGDKVRDVVRKMADRHGARTFRPHNF
jgi:hypothetical protein